MKVLVDKYNLDVGSPGRDPLREPGMCEVRPCKQGSSYSAVGGKYAEAKKDHERGQF